MHGAERSGPHVQAEHAIHALHHAGIDHRLRPTARRHFLGRLEQELHRTRHAILEAGQHFGGAHQHRGVHVVAAGVHHAGFLAVIHRTHRRLERHINQFSHRQGIHVGTQRHRRSGLAALENPHHPGNAAHVLLYFHAQRLEMRRHQRRRTLLGVAELRMLVNVVTPGGDLVGDRGGATIDVSGQRWIGGDLLRAYGRRDTQRCREQQGDEHTGRAHGRTGGRGADGKE